MHVFVFQTLYLKNLGNKVTERDLASLFIRYQTPEAPRIIFKLMKGRMRGQAFVTFDSKFLLFNIPRKTTKSLI